MGTPVILDAQWKPPGKAQVKGYLYLYVWCMGKWRPTCIRVKNPRPLSAPELEALQRQVRMNTGGKMYPSGLNFVQA